LTLRDRGDQGQVGNWIQRFFSHKNGLKFSKKVGIFPTMCYSPKKFSFSFDAGS